MSALRWPRDDMSYLENLQILPRLCQQRLGPGLVTLAPVLAERVPCAPLEVLAEVVGREPVGLPQQRAVLCHVSRRRRAALAAVDSPGIWPRTTPWLCGDV